MSATEVRVICPRCEKDGLVSISYRQDVVRADDCPLCDGAVEFDAHLIPGTDFVVSEAEWEEFVAMWFFRAPGLSATKAECEAWWSSTDEPQPFDVYWKAAEGDARFALTALLGHAPMRVAAVGVVEGDHPTAPVFIMPSGENITGCRVAILAEDGKEWRVSR